MLLHYKLLLICAGADLLGQVTAALAAISIVFAEIDASYSDMLLAHARDLWA